MALLLKQTSDDAKHHHLVVLDDQRIGGVCTVSGTSKKNRHTHEVKASPDAEAFVLTLAEDGHTHALIEILRKPVSFKGEHDKDEDIVKEVKALYRTAKDLESDFIKKGTEDFDYYEGETWTKEEQQDLKDKNRAPSNINEIEPKIDILSGYQRQNRLDLKFYPTEDGDVRVADILTTLWKNVTEQNLYDHKESDIFVDGSVAGRGLFQMRIDRDEDISGSIVIEKYPWDGAYFGPHENADLSDLEYQVKFKKISKGKLKQLWTKKAKQIETAFRSAVDLKGEPETETPQGDPHIQHKKDQYGTGEWENVELNKDDVEFVDIAKKEFLVIECVRKQYFRVTVLFNPAEDFYFNGEGVEDDDLQAVKRDVPGFEIIYRKVDRMRLTTIAHSVLLEDDFAPAGHEDFTLIPLYAKKHGKKVWGKVRTMKYPQKEVNVLHSKAIDILDKTGGYGWFSDEKTFPNNQAKQHFDNVRNTAGFHATITDSEHPPYKVEGTKFPTEVVGMMENASNKLKEVSNIIAELLGLNSKAESGVAIESKKQQGLVGNEYLFDNLRLAKILLGWRFLEMIPHVYTPEKILRVVANVHQRSPVKINTLVNGAMTPTPLDQLLAKPDFIDAVMRILKEADFIKRYDVSVGESVANPTTRRANFGIALELLKTLQPNMPLLGPAIIDKIIAMSDFPEKEEWIAAIRAVIGAGVQGNNPNNQNGKGANQNAVAVS